MSSVGLEGGVDSPGSFDRARSLGGCSSGASGSTPLGLSGRGIELGSSRSKFALVVGGRLWCLEKFGSVCRCVSAGDVWRAMSCKHGALCRAIGSWLWENSVARDGWWC